jgi:hypothetical protein
MGDFALMKWNCQYRRYFWRCICHLWNRAHSNICVPSRAARIEKQKKTLMFKESLTKGSVKSAAVQGFKSRLSKVGCCARLYPLFHNAIRPHMMAWTARYRYRSVWDKGRGENKG